MKKRVLSVLVILSVCLAVAGCDLHGEAQPTEREISYREGKYEEWFGEKMWTMPEKEINEGQADAVPDKETAIAIACAEFEKVQEKFSDVFKDHVVSSVFFDIEDEVWVVGFGHKEPMLGGGYEIAISQKTGEVLDTWGTE